MRRVQMAQVERDLPVRHAWRDTYGHRLRYVWLQTGYSLYRLRHVRLRAEHLWGTYDHQRAFYLLLAAYCTSSQL